MYKNSNTHQEKIELIKCLASGQVMPEILKPIKIIRGAFFVEKGGVWTYEGKEIDVIDDDLQGYFEKLYPDNSIEMCCAKIIA